MLLGRHGISCVCLACWSFGMTSEKIHVYVRCHLSPRGASAVLCYACHMSSSVALTITSSVSVISLYFWLWASILPPCGHLRYHTFFLRSTEQETFTTQLSVTAWSNCKFIPGLRQPVHQEDSAALVAARGRSKWAKGIPGLHPVNVTWCVL